MFLHVNLSNVFTSLIPGARGPILDALVRLEQPVSRRTLAELAGVSSSNASSIVEELISLGVVSEATAGRASMVELDRESLLGAQLIEMAGLKGELVSQMREAVKDCDLVVEAWLFGSLARGEESATSDVDVLVVSTDLESAEFNDWATSFSSLIDRLISRELQLVEHTPASFTEFVSSSNPLVRELKNEAVALKDAGILKGKLG